jgi:hypothetical protein
VKNINTKISSKGQFEEMKALHESLVHTKVWPISFEELIQTTESTFIINNI